MQTSKEFSILGAGSPISRDLARRINIPLTPTSPPGLIEAETVVDPWTKSGKYAYGWTYFCAVLMMIVTIIRVYHLWTDKIRQAMHKQEMEQKMIQELPDVGTKMSSLRTRGHMSRHDGEKGFVLSRGQAHWSTGAVNDTLALFRWMFYRPVPELKWKNKSLLSFPSLTVITIVVIALAFVTLYCFLPQPLYWQSIQYGSPPLAVRAGMIAIAMTPWIVATSMKANLISLVTGIGPERLGVFHRWGGYLCLFLSLVHTVPFYIQPVWDDDGIKIYKNLFPSGSGIIYGTGIACLVPLGWLCIGSLPFLRSLAYEVFVYLHVPVAIVYVILLFWHCKNYLASWDYLWATVAVWALSYSMRLFNLNWLKPWRNSWLVGDKAAIVLMAENAIKVTIPTQMTWRPGQYVYLRMPGISIFENHPFTISSLCSEDFPSEYGYQYRDVTLVFRPFGGFTRKVLEKAIEKGPFMTYRAYLDGPYGGMQRELAAFDTVILFAGGSGITAIMSQLLSLIKRMRDGKAVTKKIKVIWALKRLDAMDWFREELQICREYAPPGTVTCQFYVTRVKRQKPMGVSHRFPRSMNNIFHKKLDIFIATIASKRNPALNQYEAGNDSDREKYLREDSDAVTSLPRSEYLKSKNHVNLPSPLTESCQEKGHIVQMQDPGSYEGSRKFISASTLPYSEEFHLPVSSPVHDAPHLPLFSLSARNSDNQQNYQIFPTHEPKAVYRAANYISSDEIRPALLSENISGPSPQPTISSISPHIIPNHLCFRPPTVPGLAHTRPRTSELQIQIPTTQATAGFDFGFPNTPTDIQKNLVNFAFVEEGWSTEYGRPDLGSMLKSMATGGADGKGIFGRRTCVFVCGPPSMRVDVANTVASLQADIWGDDSKDEIFLHTENYVL